ncbi:MAG: hypothetical protein M1834_004476 [Cirrosporium novae-zelandiae]|nr:MAG: hypothetical protein M1834_004476 [Cirrosporium novae-zelandiae]
MAAFVTMGITTAPTTISVLSSVASSTPTNSEEMAMIGTTENITIHKRDMWGYPRCLGKSIHSWDWVCEYAYEDGLFWQKKKSEVMSYIPDSAHYPAEQPIYCQMWKHRVSDRVGCGATNYQFLCLLHNFPNGLYGKEIKEVFKSMLAANCSVCAEIPLKSVLGVYLWADFFQRGWIG